ncbi:trypsin-like peptidase domain-containing protein [Acidobacteriota bacterium]
MAKANRIGIVLIILSIAIFTLGQVSEARIRAGWPVDHPSSTPHPYEPGSEAYPIVWQEIITDPGATYIAVHFAAFSLATGDRCIIANLDGTESYVFEGEGLNDGGEFWATSIIGDSAVISLESAGGPGGYGLDIDQYSRGEIPLLPMSVCGADDRKNAKCYQTSHSTEYEKAKAVGRLLIAGSFLCTGSLVSCDNHFMTNEHCVTDQWDVSNTEIRMMFETQQCNGGGETWDMVVRGDQFLQDDVVLDYCLMTVTDDPASIYGHMILTDRAPQMDEIIFFPQHPGGRPKNFGLEDDMTAGGLCRIRDPDRDGNGAGTDFGYYCDSEGGSSGSPVMSRTDYKMIGLHHFGTPGGGPCTDTIMNSSVKMSLILPEVDPILPPCSTCDVPPIPTNLQAQNTADNEVTLTWDHPGPGLILYTVYRSTNGCDGPWEIVGASFTKEFIDPTVSGGVTYYYKVTAKTECESEKSACTQIVPTGGCRDLPLFNGVKNVRTMYTSFCQIRISWDAGTHQCGTAVAYNIYRSNASAFIPDASSLLASCIAGTTYMDYDLTSGESYYYLVKAEDNSGDAGGPCTAGNEDLNTIIMGDTVWGPMEPGEFFDGAESDTGFIMAPESSWSRTAAQSSTGAWSYLISGAINGICSSLNSPSLELTGQSRLYYSAYVDDIQDRYDGGIVEISTDGGSNWEKLIPSTGYPGMLSRFTTACTYEFRYPDRGAYTGHDPLWRNYEVDLSTFGGLDAIIRFRFGTNENQPSTAWYVDDIRISDVLMPGNCSQGTPPPGEVSGPGSGIPMWLAKQGQDILMSFEERPEALGYNVYQGNIGDWYSHGNIPFDCSASVTPGQAPGRLETVVTPGGASALYYLVTAWNGDPVTGQEGTSGSDSRGNPRPPGQSTCDPINNF